MPIKFLLLLTLLLGGCLHGHNHVQKENNGDQCSSLSMRVDSFMDDIFGVAEPKLEDYYKYQGIHSEEEYEAEIEFCKTNWGNPQNVADESYIEHMPGECKSWLLARAKTKKIFRYIIGH